jgi:oligopeptide/dipeptide ABC transporter ATP-binding protein
VEIGDLTLSVPSGGGTVPILNGVGLRVGSGEAVGVVGESGSGKSMMLRCLSRLTPPGSLIGGTLRVVGKDVMGLSRSALRQHRREIGMVFQDPRSAINPAQRIGAFLVEVARDRGEDVRAARTSAMSMLDQMGIPDPERRMDQYPFELSGGLLQRVMIASVLLGRPSVILADEPTTALDVTTQSDVLALADELRRDQGVAMLFVTHDLDLAMAVCDRVVVLYAGSVLETADARTVAEGPLHPYTRGLLASRPPLTHRLAEIPVVPGVPVFASAAGHGCPFVARCAVALPVCSERFPGPTRHSGGVVHCHRAHEIVTGALDGALPLRGDAAVGGIS